MDKKSDQKVEVKDDNVSRLSKLDKKLRESDNQRAWPFDSEIVQKSLLPLKGDISFNTYLDEFAEGTHLNDTLLGDLVLLKSQKSSKNKEFLEGMEAEDGSELSYLKELYLGGYEIFNADMNDKTARLDALMKPYTKLTEMKNSAAILFMNLLRYERDVPMNQSELLDLAENGNSRALTLIGIDCDEGEENLNWLQWGLSKGDYLAYWFSYNILETSVEKKSKTCNNFSLNYTYEFTNLLKCKEGFLELEFMLETRKFPDRYFDFFSNFYNTNSSFRETGLKNAMKILRFPEQFSQSNISSAYEFFCDKTLGKVCDRFNSDRNDLGMLLLEEGENNEADFLRECEERYKKNLKKRFD